LTLPEPSALVTENKRGKKTKGKQKKTKGVGREWHFQLLLTPPGRTANAARSGVVPWEHVGYS
jgi:hypothetical protein